MKSNDEKLDNYQEVEHINTLLDIERFSGESSSSLAPTMIFLTVAGAPWLLYVYFLLGVIPLKYAIPVLIFHTIRAAMVTLGEERKRIELYKQQMYDEYSSILDMMHIKKIHPDGLIEYKKNWVSYLVVAHNGGSTDPIVRAQGIKKLFTNIASDYTVDVYGQNILDSDDLINRYEGISFFTDPIASKNYLDLIDYNRKIIKQESLVTRIVFKVSARKRDHKKMRKSLETVLFSEEAKSFKELVLADGTLAEDIVSRDIDTHIDFDEIHRKQFAKGLYFDSHVEEYDYSSEEKVKNVKVERGFMKHDKS